MSGINGKRVVLGGLVAGLLSNVLGIASAHFLFEADVNALMQRLGVTPGLSMVFLHVGMRLAVGFGVVWLYAAIRPRYGAEPRTAMLAGVAVWLATFMFSFAGIAPYGLYAERTLLLAAIWTFFEMQAVALAGARLYRE